MTLKRFPFFLFISALLLSSCASLKETKTLSKCEFRLSTIENIRLAGVVVTDKNGISDLDLVNAGRITTSLLTGKLPISFIVNVEVRNPNRNRAALNRLEYIIYIDDKQIFTGAMDQWVEIPPNDGIATIPLFVSTDLISIFRNESRNAVLGLAFNLTGRGNVPTRVTARIRPDIKVGRRDIRYPGYINVSRTFTSGNSK